MRLRAGGPAGAAGQAAHARTRLGWVGDTIRSQLSPHRPCGLGSVSSSGSRAGDINLPDSPGDPTRCDPGQKEWRGRAPGSPLWTQRCAQRLLPPTSKDASETGRTPPLLRGKNGEAEKPPGRPQSVIRCHHHSSKALAGDRGQSEPQALHLLKSPPSQGQMPRFMMK